MFCVAGGPNKKSCTNSGDTPGIIACIVFRKICLYEGNGFVLFEDIGLTSTMKRILQVYGLWLCSAHFDASCSSRAIYKVLIANTKRFLTRGSVATTDVVETGG